MEMTKEEFEKWVAERVHEGNENNCESALIIAVDSNYTVIETHDNRGLIVVDRRTGKTGISKCHPNDEFDYNIGFALAYARLKGMEIPTIKKSIEEKIKEEIEEFILDNIAEPCFDLLIEDSAGVCKYNNCKSGREALAERILRDITDCVNGTIYPNFSTPQELWNYYKEEKYLGCDCNLYYRDTDSDYVIFA